MWKNDKKSDLKPGDSHFPHSAGARDNQTGRPPCSSSELKKCREVEEFTTDTQVLSSAGKMDAVSQMPVVLLPIHFDRFFIGEKTYFVHTLNCSQISAGASAVVLQICCYQAVQVKGGSIQH